ncbi:MAG: lysostaphin resistance A-like protein [Candidatus Helarchaeota archaeon]
MTSDLFRKSTPSIIYIILCVIILILSLEFIPNIGFPFKINLNMPAEIEYQFIHTLPILFSFLMIIPILYIMWKPEVLTKRFDVNLRALEPTTDFKKVLLIGIYYTILICIFRTFIVNIFTLPFEKLPMIWLIVFQILLVEQYFLSDFGIHGKKLKENIVLGIVYLFLMVIILLGPVVLLAIILFAPQLLALWGQISPYMIPPNGLFLIAFIYQALFVGLSEELIYRGWLYGKLRRSDKLKDKKYGMFWAILISSLIFGCFHLPWYVHFNGWMFDAARTFSLSNLADAGTRVISTGFFGILMCLVYEKTKSLISPIIIHGLSNTIPLFLGSMFFPLLNLDYMNLINNFILTLPIINLVIFGIIIVIVAIPLLIIGLKYLTPWIIRICKAEADA